MARTLSEGLSNGMSSLSGAMQRRNLAKQAQLENAIKLAELQSKGVQVTEQQTPRKLFGVIPAGTQRSLSLSYDPSMNPDYQKSQLETEKLRQEVTGTQPISPLDQSRIDYNKSRAAGGDQLTPGQQLAKDKATKEIFETVEANKVKKRTLQNAKEALPNVPQGFLGKVKTEWIKRMDPNNPMLEDWQKIKMIGTDAQLMNTALTKGAISDREMALFSQAAANDDIMSVPRIKPVLDKLARFIDAQEAGQFGAYQKNYGEDPRGWFPDSEGDSGDASEPSEEDIQFTMQKYGMTRDQVLRELQNG